MHEYQLWMKVFTPPESSETVAVYRWELIDYFKTSDEAWAEWHRRWVGREQYAYKPHARVVKVKVVPHP